MALPKMLGDPHPSLGSREIQQMCDSDLKGSQYRFQFGDFIGIAAGQQEGGCHIRAYAASALSFAGYYDPGIALPEQ
jgi:hypothetical protein